MEDNSHFSIEEVGNKSIGYKPAHMIFINQFNVLRNMVKNYIKLQRNRSLNGVYTQELFLQKLDGFIERIGLVNQQQPLPWRRSTR